MRNLDRTCDVPGIPRSSAHPRSCYWARHQADTMIVPAYSPITACRLLSPGGHWKKRELLKRRVSRPSCASRDKLQALSMASQSSLHCSICATCWASSIAALYVTISPPTYLRAQEKGVFTPTYGN